MTHDDIRIGTLVSANQDDPVGYLRQIHVYGFESYQLTFWRTLHGHDLPKLATRVLDLLGDDAVISSLGIYGNPLMDTPEDVATREAWGSLIDAAHLFGTDLVCGFTGRLTGQSIDASLPVFAEVFAPLAKRATDAGVRLAFENCAMDGTWHSGDWNIAHSPAAWEKMFDALPYDHLGLEWEPCHQMVALIDPMPQLPTWCDRIFHVHGKDASVHWDRIRKHGIIGDEPFAFHRTPGFGDSDWTAIISLLRQHGFRGSIDIEGWHDPVYRDTLEMTGQVHALQYLKHCRGGPFIPNPT